MNLYRESPETPTCLVPCSQKLMEEKEETTFFFAFSREIKGAGAVFGVLYEQLPHLNTLLTM